MFSKSISIRWDICYLLSIWFLISYFTVKAGHAKRTPQDSINEVIIWKINPLVVPVTIVKFISAFQHAYWAGNILYKNVSVFAKIGNLWIDKIASKTFTSKGRDESEIYNYQRIQLSNNKFLNRILGAGYAWTGLTLSTQTQL